MHAVIDTNLLIYDTVEDSVHHSESRELLNSLDRWLIPTIVLYEYVWFFKRQELGTDVVRDLLHNYIGDPRVDVLTDAGAITERAVETLLHDRQDLRRFNDAVILETAKDAGQLATFDQDLRREAHESSVSILPEQ